MEQAPKPFMDFMKAVFLIGGRYHTREKARKDLNEHISQIRQKAHHRKHISVHEINHIEEKVGHLLEKEKRLHSFNAVEQEKLRKMAEKIIVMEKKLFEERLAKQRLANEMEGLGRQKSREMAELKETLNRLKRSMHEIMRGKQSEVGRRKTELDALDRKINKEIEIGASY